MTNDPTGRALELLSLLQTHRRWTGPELTGRLEVSARTLRRDVDRLRSLGYPVEATPGVDGGYRLGAGSHLPPLVLDDEEAVAIAVGLRAAAGAAISGIEETSLRALAKLEQVLPGRLRRRVSAVHANVTTLRWSNDDATVDPDALAVLAQACRDSEEVRFDYERRDGESSSRLVEPHDLVAAGQRWYLAAYDLRREDWRTFRLDRLTAAQLAGRRFSRRELPDGGAAAYVTRSMGQIPRSLEATVRLACTAEEAGDILRWTHHDVLDGDEATCLVQLRADSIPWLVSTVAFIARHTDVAVEAPPELVEGVKALAERLRAATPAPT